MKRHSLLTTVSVLSIPFVVLTGAPPAIAEDDGCGGMNFFQCQVSRAVYAVEHIGQPQKSNDQSQAAQGAAPTAPTKDQLTGAAAKINDLAITGIITSDQAAQALKLVAAGGGNLVAAGGGNLVAAGGGNLVAAGGGNLISSDAASIVAANALALSGASAQKSQIAAALVSEGGNGLRSASQVVQQNMIVGFYDAGKITDTQALALSKLVAAGGGNLVAAGGGNLVAAGGGNLVAAGGGNLVAAGGGNFTLTGAAANLVAAGGGNLISNGGTPLVAAGGGNLVAAGGGNLVAAGGGNLVAAGGGNLVAAGGGNLLSTNGGNLVAAGGGNLVSNAGGTLVAAGGGNIISDNSEGLLAKSGGNLASVSSLISEHGAGLVSAAGLSGARTLQDVGSSDKGQKVASLIESVTGPTPAQLAAQKALTDTQKAASDFVSASDLVKRDGLALQNARLGTDQSLVIQLQKKLDTDSAAMVSAGGVMMDKSKQVAAGDVATVSTLLNKSVDTAGANAKAASDAANAGPAKSQPTQLQIDTANAAAATAATAAKSASDANAAVLALTKTLGNNPTNTADQLKVNEAMQSSALESAKAQLAKAQSDLVTMSKNGASAYDIKGQNDLITKAQTNLNFQSAMVSNDYAAKAITANTAAADLATAKSVVDGLTKAYGSNRPTDPVQLATINAAMVVQALAQDKADQTAADTQRIRLIASGASASDIKTQADLIAVKQQDMANILKVNPTIVAAAGAAVNSDPALVQKAITNLVSTAATQSNAAVQLTSAQAQAALNAVQQLKSGATTAATTTSGGTDLTALLSTVTKAASTYSIKSLSTDTAAKPATTTTTQVASTSPVVTAANPAATQVANPATTSPATSAVTAPVTTGPVAAPVDKSEMTPAVVQMLLGSGDSVITAMKAAQQAAIAKGDTATADGLGKDIVNLQAQIAVAKTMPPPAATTTASATTTTGPATTTTTNPTAATTSPTVVAATNPTSPATGAATTSAATSTAKAADSPAPTKITAEQGKAVQQALRTVPGNLSKTDEKNLSTLSALVDRAATKGLTPDEAAQLKSGLAALAEKHPKAEKQIGLTKIANSVAVQKPANETAAKPATTAPAEGKVAVTTPPTATAPAEAKPLATTAPGAAGAAAVAKPIAGPASEGKVAVTTPATSPAPSAALPGAALPGPKTATPVVTPSQASTKPTEHTAIAVPPTAHTQEMKQPPVAPKSPEAHNLHNDMARLPPQPTAPKPPVVAAPPKPPAVATAAPKPTVAPVVRAQSCTPNMVNGKMMGMTCH